MFLSVELESGVHDCDVKLPDVMCYRGRKLTTTNFSLFWNLFAFPKDAISGKFAYILQVVPDGIFALKFQGAHMYPISDLLLPLPS